jgi:hypothetical protein
MSKKAEEFAEKLIERTNENKLKWRYVADPDVEKYTTEAEAGISFSIARKSMGDNKVLTFGLAELGRVVLSDSVNNIPMDPKIRGLSEEARTSMSRLNGGDPVESLSEYGVRRFRLYSDLFYAARKVAEGRDLAIEKAEQFLARLA